MSNLSDFTGGNTFPQLKSSIADDSTTFEVAYRPYTVKGVVGDGDYYELPKTASGVLTYYDASSVLQWTKTTADFETAAGGVTFQAYGGITKLVGGNIYLLAIELAIPDFYHLLVIDPTTGATSLVGTAQHAAVTDLSPDYIAGKSSLHLTTPSPIVFEMRSEVASTTPNQMQSVFVQVINGPDITVTSPVIQTTVRDFSLGYGVRLAENRHMQMQQTTTATNCLISSRDSYRYFSMPLDSNFTSGSPASIEWDGEIYFWLGTFGSTSDSGDASRVYSLSDLTDYADKVLAHYNVDLEVI